MITLYAKEIHTTKQICEARRGKIHAKDAQNECRCNSPPRRQTAKLGALRVPIALLQATWSAMKSVMMNR